MLHLSRIIVEAIKVNNQINNYKMKKFTLIFAFLMSVSVMVIAQPQLSWRFANYQVINAGAQLQFDVEVKADVAGTFHRDLQIYFDYNTTAFGADIVLNGSISYIPLTLLDDVAKYQVVNTADNTSSKFAIITEAVEEMNEVGSSTYYIEVTDTYQGLIQFTLDILPGTNTELCGIAFDEALMNGGQYYQSTSVVEPVKYADPSVYENNISSINLSTLYGTITYANVTSDPIADCTVDGGAAGTAMTDMNGEYNFSNVADGAYTLTTTCSLPYTHITDVSDANVVIDHILSTPLTGVYFLAGDVDGSTSIDVSDLNLMIDNILGTTVGYPTADWVFEVQPVNVSAGIGTASYQGLMVGDADGSK
jgi:hypothetical protein